MKLLSFRPARARSGHFGALLSDNRVLDISALAGRKLPSTLLECIQQGASALSAVQAAVADAETAMQRGDAPPQVFALDSITLQAPLKPGKIMAVGKNYADHAAEGGGQAYTRVSGFIKLSSCVVAHETPIRKPAWTETLDYETELAIVIGRACSDVAPEAAFEYVFGYTIMNDLSCRDVQYAERKEGNICIGKNFPTSAPLGPWIVTKDEIPDPHNLKILTRINGEVRQNNNTAFQIYRIPAQIAWYSHAGFEPGDIISSGTPAGTATGYKGPGTWWLQHGDRVECEIEKIGVLANTVTSRKQRR